MGCMCCKQKKRDEHNPYDGGISELPVSDNANQINKDDFYIRKKVGESIIRIPGSVAGLDFVIEDCEKCNFYICDYSSQITIDDCKDCNFVIGPISGSFFLRNCEGCTVVVACQQFRTRDVQNCSISLFTKTQPIIESSSDINFSCFSISWPGLQEQFKQVDMSVFQNQWSEIYDFTPSPNNWGYFKNSALKEILSDIPSDVFGTNDPFEKSSLVVPLTWGTSRPSPSGEDSLRQRLVQEMNTNTELTLVQVKETELLKAEAVSIFGRQDSLPIPLREKIGKGTLVVGFEFCAESEVRESVQKLCNTVIDEFPEMKDFLYISDDLLCARDEISGFFDSISMDMGEL